MIGPFKLFSEESNFWSFADYQCVLDVMERVKPRRVLEFGPGHSTLALVEGGAEEIVSLESDPEWGAIWERRHSVFPQIKIRRFAYAGVCAYMPDLSLFDMALIDGPHNLKDRPFAIRYALERCAAVLVPTEDEGDKVASFLRPHITTFAAEFNCSLEWMETGPPSGGFALMRKR